jgi:tryptophan synthase alpha chain
LLLVLAARAARVRGAATIAAATTGFIYYVSREGVTGMQTKVADTLGQMVAKIRTHTQLPVAVGFGISTPEQARTVAGSADAVVVGSAIVNQIGQGGKVGDIVPRVSRFVENLLEGVKKP